MRKIYAFYITKRKKALIIIALMIPLIFLFLLVVNLFNTILFNALEALPGFS